MNAVIGIDVGTTETKCCVLLGETIVFEARQPTSPAYTHNQAVFLDLTSIWNDVLILLSSGIREIRNASSLVISIACQAPTLCAWDDADLGRGISYLSYYGDPTLNSQVERSSKAYRRLSELIRTLPEKHRTNISGLTGYLVYQLTRSLTLDSVTAWEIGIEAPDDERRFWDSTLPFNCPKIYEPVFSLPLCCAELPQLPGVCSSVIVGATDSAVLPLSVWPDFPDYYIYLGTWGSLLQSAIRDTRAFCRRYWSGTLHKWIMSFPDMAARHSKDPSILPSFFKEAAGHIPKGKSVALCGGILRSSRSLILDLVNTYLPETTTIIAPDASTALAAARLGVLSVDQRCYS